VSEDAADASIRKEGGETMQVIHRLTVVSNPTRIFEVGTELDGHEVIEIKQVGSEFDNSIHSEFQVLDENGELISSIENAPVIVDYKKIAVHDEVKNGW
jgi:hypothetical protein